MIRSAGRPRNSGILVFHDVTDLNPVEVKAKNQGTGFDGCGERILRQVKSLV